MRATFFLALSGACLPALGAAQVMPRLYAGASAVLVSDAPFDSYGSSQVGPAATLGVQFSPRWAIETGVQATWRSQSFSYTALAGGTSFDAYTYRVRSTALRLPLLARYTFTAPSARLRVDALGGGYWTHTFQHNRETITSSGQTTDTDYRNAYNNLGLTLGPQLRYGLGARLEAKLNLPVNVRLSGYGNLGNRLSLIPQLGVQYTFGQ